jgi:hypothetical protein
VGTWLRSLSALGPSHEHAQQLVELEAGLRGLDINAVRDVEARMLGAFRGAWAYERGTPSRIVELRDSRSGGSVGMQSAAAPGTRD